MVGLRFCIASQIVGSDGICVVVGADLASELSVQVIAVFPPKITRRRPPQHNRLGRGTVLALPSLGLALRWQATGSVTVVGHVTRYCVAD